MFISFLHCIVRNKWSNFVGNVNGTLQSSWKFLLIEKCCFINVLLPFKRRCFPLKDSSFTFKFGLLYGDHHVRYEQSKQLERNRGYYMAAQRYEISLRVLKNISRLSAANKWNIQHKKRNFVSPSDHVMLYLLYKHQWTTKPFHSNEPKFRPFLF